MCSYSLVTPVIVTQCYKRYIFVDRLEKKSWNTKPETSELKRPY